MEERYGKIVFGDLEVEVKGDEVITRKNGILVNSFQIPEVPQQEKVPHFFKMTSNKRKRVRRWLRNQESVINYGTDKEKKFLKVVKEGLETIKYDYWISTIEPTMNKKTQKIEFIEGAKVAVGYSCNQWKKFAEEFMPERGSRLAELCELFLWYAWRIVKGYWTLDYVANDSFSSGNYANSPNHSGEIEKSAARKVGKFRDGIGNTCKIVTHEVRYALVGGCYSNFGDCYPVGDVDYCNHPNFARYSGSGVFVLTK